MKLLTASVVCAVLVTNVDAGAYQDGYKEGEREARNLWYKDYKAKCDNVFLYSVASKDRLLNDKYKYGRYDNWRDDAFKRGGRDGVQREVLKYQKQCIDPIYCDDLGEQAASIVVADFCDIRTAFAAKKKEPVPFCRQAATRTCQGKLVDAIKQVGSCPEIGDNPNNLTNEQWLDLQDDCEEQVDAWIKWDDLEPEKDSRKDTGNNKSKIKYKGKGKGKGKGKKKKKKDKRHRNQGLRALKDVYQTEQEME